MFNIGDTVTYKSEGVCRIADIVEKNFSGSRTTYYVLRPIYKESSTVYVPTQNEILTSKMKRILSVEEIDKTLNELKLLEPFWPNDPDERKQYYKDLLALGNRARILMAVFEIKKRQVPVAKNARKPHIFDLHFMREQEKIICEEFGLVLKNNPSEIWEYIENKLNQQP